MRKLVREVIMKRDKRIKLTVFALIFSVLILSSHLFSQDSESYKWMFEGTATLSKVHEGGFRSPGLAFRAHRFLKNSGSNHSVEVNVLASTSFLSLGAGLRLRLLQNGTFSPFIGGGAGLGTCGEWIGLIFRGNFGIEFKIGPQSIFIAQYQIGSHGSQAGPSFFAIGVGYSFGLLK
jgi:hypothetical protein